MVDHAEFTTAATLALDCPADRCWSRRRIGADRPGRASRSREPATPAGRLIGNNVMA